MHPEAGTRAFIALGANLGDARTAVREAMDAIHALAGISVLHRSSLYGSKPLEADGGDYVNAVVEVQTALAPQALLEQLQAIEQKAGRERSYQNAPRTLDLDILLYGELAIQTETLTIPHPRMRARAFVLLPLHEIAPERVTSAELSAVASQGIWRLD